MSFLFSSGVLGAIPDSVVDDFEAQQYEDKNNTLSDYYAGDLSPFVRQQTTIKNGSYALESSFDGTQQVISSTSGLNNYPAQDDTFRCWFRKGSSNDNPGIYWATQQADASPGGYLIRHDGLNDALDIFREDTSGSLTLLNNTNVSLSTGTWYEFEVEWLSDGSITGKVFDDTNTEQASVSTSDSNYTSGGIGFRTNNANDQSSTDYWDHYRVI